MGHHKMSIFAYVWVCICVAGSLAHVSGLPVIGGTNNEASAREEKVQEKGKVQGKVLNLYGRAVGLVDAEGVVHNLYGRSVGSVDKDGIVYNVSKIVIGKVDPGGEVFNQAGTLLGSVDDKGEVFNRIGRKVGSVETEGNIILAGGAARLLLLVLR